MEALPRSIGGIVGQFMQDQGAALALQNGPQASDTARQIAELVMQGVAQVDPRTAQRFPQNPEGYMAPLADSLGEAMQADPGLAARLEALLERYEELARAHAAGDVITVDARTRDGAIAIGEGATALGAGATQIQIGGDVPGGAVSGGEHPSQAPAQGDEQP
jgi:hypothetical protein